MKKEDVVRDGRFVLVAMGGVERQHEYSSDWAARAAWTRLYLSKEARARFLRRRRQT